MIPYEVYNLIVSSNTIFKKQYGACELLKLPKNVVLMLKIKQNNNKN